MNVVFIHTSGTDEALRLTLGGNVMLAARIIFTFHLPLANQLSLKVLVFSSGDMKIVPSAFAFAENQKENSLGFYIMGKGKSPIPKHSWRLDK